MTKKRTPPPTAAEKLSHAEPGKLSRAQTVRQLAQRLEKMEVERRSGLEQSTPTGIAALDKLLPTGGFRNGTLIEWLADSSASGVDLLALLSARPALGTERVIVVLDREQTFYPPASAAWGIAPKQTIVVRPKNGAEELWALEQCLRSSGVAVSLCRLERAKSESLRRLQLAIERGGGLGFLLRPISTRGQPAWSDVRLLVSALPANSSRRRWRVELIRSRRGAGEKVILLELDDATGLVSPFTELVPAARTTRAARA